MGSNNETFEVWLNTSLNGTKVVEEEAFYYFEPYAVVVVYTVVSLLAIVPNVLIATTLKKFNILRTTRNIIVMNWAIADIIFLLGEPSKFLLIFHHFRIHNMSIYGGLISFNVCSHIYVIILVLLLFVDCFYKKLTVEKLVRSLPFMWITYVAVVIPCAILTGIYNQPFVEFLTYGLLFLGLMITYLVKVCLYTTRRARRKPLKNQLRFLLTSGYVTCLVFSFVFGLLMTLFNLAIFQWSQYMYSLFQMLSLSNSFIQLALLLYFDNDFQSCFLKLVKRTNSSNVVSYNTATGITNHITEEF